MNLPDLDGWPEGVAGLGDDRFLIVLDCDVRRNNGAIVSRS